jgi:hypothetical protein
MPARFRTLLYLEGKIVKGGNENFDIPSDCEEWLKISGDGGQFDEYLSTGSFNVEYANNHCWVYHNMYSR